MIQVIDDALPQWMFDRICKFVFNNQFSWYYGKTALATDTHMSFSHTVGDWNLPYAELLGNSAYTISDKSNISIKDIYRIRLGLITPEENPKTNLAHVDHFINHYTFLLYLNDSDGDTVLYNEKFDPEKCPDDEQGINFIIDHLGGKLTVAKKVSPKPNRVVVFDGLQYHASTPPSKSGRIAINYNVIV